MSDQKDTTLKPVPKFPDREVSTLAQTYDFPNVLKDIGDHSGRDVVTVITGGFRQVEMLSEHWLSDEIVEQPAMFAIQARNQIFFSGQNISVLNDAVSFNGVSLPPSNPSAAEYFAQVGKQVFIHFKCALLNPDSAAARTYRDDPKKAPVFGNANKPIYAVWQTSMILQ